MAFDQNKPATNGTLASVDIRNNLQHLKGAVAKEHNWSDADPNATTHNLDAMSIAVTGSAQGNIATGGVLAPTYSNAAYCATVLTQIAGIGAGTYSVRNLLQELVNRSHNHSTASIYHNCNCACDCAGSCFPAGTLVLMADHTWKAIEEVQVGERVIGLGGVNNVVGLMYPVLAQRSLMTFPDKDLLFSAEHPFWIRKPDGKEWFGTSDFNEYKREQRYDDYIGLSKSEPYVITEAVDYAHLSGWKHQKTITLHHQHDPNLQLYHLLTDGSHTYIANGYVVGGQIRDDNFDYEGIRWDVDRAMQG